MRSPSKRDRDKPKRHSGVKFLDEPNSDERYSVLDDLSAPLTPVTPVSSVLATEPVAQRSPVNIGEYMRHLPHIPGDGPGDAPSLSRYMGAAPSPGAEAGFGIELCVGVGVGVGLC